jgi:hypothetical protein
MFHSDQGTQYSSKAFIDYCIIREKTVMAQQTWTHFKPLFPIQPSSEQVLNTQSLNESFCNCKSRYWNEILSENGFIKNLCSREWSFLV